MARLTLTSGFTLMDEGTQVVRIYGVEYKEVFGNLTVYLINAKGQTMRETFRFKSKDGGVNEGAMNAFSYFAKVAMNDMSLADIDPEELVDHYVQIDVVHNISETNGNTYANMGHDKAAAAGFDIEPVEAALTTYLKPKPTTTTTADSSNIDDLLGGI